MSWLVALKTLGRLAGAMIAVGVTEKLSSRSSAMQWCLRFEVELREVEAAWGAAKDVWQICWSILLLQVRQGKVWTAPSPLGCKKKFDRGTYRCVAVVAGNKLR